MKITKLKLGNFGKFQNFEIEFDRKITRLVGLNGSGKSTAGLTGIWVGFKGISQKSSNGQLVGERFRFIGKKGPRLDVEITLIDEKTGNEIVLKRHITKDVNQISFESTNGKADIDETWLKDLLNMSFLSAKHFANLSGEEQTRALGIDVEKFDKKLAEKKEEARYIRRDLKAFGELKEVEKTEAVNILELFAERDRMLDFNREQQEKKTEIDHAIELLEELEKERQEIEARLSLVQERIEQGTKHISTLSNLEAEMDTSKLDRQIANSEEINRKSHAYETYLQHKKRREEKQIELNENLSEQKEIIDKRSKYIRSFDFGFAGLSVDESGQLVLDERPIKEPYFSRSELEIIVAKLHAAMVKDENDLWTRFIDDFDVFDAANQEKIIEFLVKEKGFQLIVAEVGDEALKENTVLLRECRVEKSLTGSVQESLL